ncbi:hypothetical protein Pmani_004064 [Petrolisthes manimaculis]|uniref:Protein kinase domain-containing protein n=1 Tax=Petrolisthes manimaculis TaxID=1843537 RepID=A0AAE1QH94_9EUCA|nr:hypothetical protein Pmani_004064 [Petrolisthes manimaculis]
MRRNVERSTCQCCCCSFIMVYRYRKLVQLGLLGVGGLSVTYNSDELENAAIGAVRFGRAALTVTKIVADYRQSLYSGAVTPESSNYADVKSQTHLRSAKELLELCCVNGGAFVKVGQHLGSLEYLLPTEYVSTMKVLHSSAPQSSLKDIYQVIQEELKCEPQELFIEFDPEPLGAASLAQVHRARLKDGREVAVKVQHPTVKAHSRIDMKGMELLVGTVSLIFPEFNFEWLVEEMKKNLPKELDFASEARNAEKVAAQFSHFPWLKIPAVDWNLTTDRVLVMEFCQGGQVNDRTYMLKHNINTKEVSEKLGHLYSEMIFVNGYVHCDPHPGNVLVQKVDNEAQIILLDHGLYTNLTNDFRLKYSNLWMSILNADLDSIQKYGNQLGVGELYGLFACMVTGRSWNSISQGIDKTKRTSHEQDEIKSDVAKYLPEISSVLNRVPRQMLLIFKTNDLLRGIEFSLNTQESMKSFLTMWRCCVRCVFSHQKTLCNSAMCSFKVSLSESWANLKISLYTFYLVCLHSGLSGDVLVKVCLFCHREGSHLLCVSGLCQYDKSYSSRGQELNFTSEAHNSEKAAAQYVHLPWLKIPAIDWNLTTDRVLVMEFCQGGQVNDRTYMLKHNINTKEVSEKLGHLYSEMIFVNGYVHCDPHPGNILV